ncbi:ribonuclease P protein subunit p38 isoform X2 [Trachemys scripta elegans]|uniref:ribonuclease P protein subunit p38 isoform X2 n=1 Tax=Trachemys scripta elegans TaxID=31138 RepID=UPI001556BFEE|nr:ribonuclease P protein subunit p38 isoform X2 [Trachemys scripta elegans]
MLCYSRVSDAGRKFCRVWCSEVSTGLQIFNRTSTVWRTKSTGQSEQMVVVDCLQNSVIVPVYMGRRAEVSKHREKHKDAHSAGQGWISP